MNLLNYFYRKKDEQIKSYEDFWNWFQKNEKNFYKVVKNQGNVVKDFFDKLAPKLHELNDGFFYLTGMYDDNTAELIITADGTIKNLIFVEELIESAPKIENWRFTAHKPAIDIIDNNINMDGYKFNNENISFYSNDFSEFPDEIDITIIHNDFNDKNQKIIINGIYIFLDNYLGELNFATTIDSLAVIGKGEIKKEPIPIEKLKDYLIWRQKEFVEKYEGLRYDTENDNYSGHEALLQNGKPYLAIINSELLNWDCKASHPWILVIEIKYDGENNNGMPDDNTYALLNEIEEKIMVELKDFEGYLNIGRQTADSIREIYFACNEFRKPSKVLNQIQKIYTNKINIDFDIYKDKYWQSFNRFINC